MRQYLSDLKIERGKGQLACVQLTEKGPYRWYTKCCRTPIGNTLATHKMPFVGLILSCVDAESHTLNQLLGKVRFRIFAKFATGDRSTLKAHEGISFPGLLKIIWKLFLWRVRGDGRRNPFFDADTGSPVMIPTNAKGEQL